MHIRLSWIAVHFSAKNYSTIYYYKTTCIHLIVHELTSKIYGVFFCMFVDCIWYLGHIWCSTAKEAHINTNQYLTVKAKTWILSFWRYRNYFLPNGHLSFNTAYVWNKSWMCDAYLIFAVEYIIYIARVFCNFISSSLIEIMLVK